MWLKTKLESLNGFGWFVGLIVNVIWATLLVAGLYWKIHEEMAVNQAVAKERAVRLEEFIQRADKIHERLEDRYDDMMNGRHKRLK